MASRCWGTTLLGRWRLVVIALGLTFFFLNHDVVRLDGTSEQSQLALARYTNSLIKELETTNPILVEAFISRQIPEDYVKTKVDLISKLNELKAKGGNQIRCAHLRQPGAVQRGGGAGGGTVRDSTAHGFWCANAARMQEKDLFMGAAFTCGLEKVVVPFFDQGIPVEYELVRSITHGRRSRSESDWESSTPMRSCSAASTCSGCRRLRSS